MITLERLELNHVGEERTLIRVYLSGGLPTCFSFCLPYSREGGGTPETTDDEEEEKEKEEKEEEEEEEEEEDIRESWVGTRTCRS